MPKPHTTGICYFDVAEVQVQVDQIHRKITIELRGAPSEPEGGYIHTLDLHIHSGTGDPSTPTPTLVLLPDIKPESVVVNLIEKLKEDAQPF